MLLIYIYVDSGLSSKSADNILSIFIKKKLAKMEKSAEQYTKYVCYFRASSLLYYCVQVSRIHPESEGLESVDSYSIGNTTVASLPVTRLSTFKKVN